MLTCGGRTGLDKASRVCRGTARRPCLPLLPAHFAPHTPTARSHFPIRKLADVLELRRSYMAVYAELKMRTGGSTYWRSPPVPRVYADLARCRKVYQRRYASESGQSWAALKGRSLLL